MEQGPQLEPDDLRTIMEGLFNIQANVLDIKDDVRVIRALLEDEDEEEEENDDHV